MTLRFRLAVLAVLLLPMASRAEDARPISVAEAAAKVDEKVTVEMEVKSTGGKGPWFLNSEADFKDKANFTLFIPREAAGLFKKAGIEKPAEHFKGKVVQVTGTVTLHNKKPQIKVEDLEQIKIVEKK